MKDTLSLTIKNDDSPITNLHGQFKSYLESVMSLLNMTKKNPDKIVTRHEFEQSFLHETLLSEKLRFLF